LVTKLAENGLIDPALQLARALLEVIPDPRRRRSRKDDSEFSLPPEASARFDAWHYERILGRAMPALLQRAPWETFDLLGDLLDRAVKFSRLRRRDDPEDYSYIWRRAIEDNVQNRGDHDVKMLLVSGLRDAGEAILAANPAGLEEAIRRLEAR